MPTGSVKGVCTPEHSEGRNGSWSSESLLFLARLNTGLYKLVLRIWDLCVRTLPSWQGSTPGAASVFEWSTYFGPMDQIWHASQYHHESGDALSRTSTLFLNQRIMYTIKRYSRQIRVFVYGISKMAEWLRCVSSEGRHILLSKYSVAHVNTTNNIIIIILKNAPLTK